MRRLVFLTMLLISSCGDKTKTFIIGQSTRADLVALKGNPLREEVIPVPHGKILTYRGDEKYQLKGEVVVNSFKNPSPDQSLLLFWKHRFKGCVTTLKKISLDSDSHTPPEMELACPSQGLRVIYTEGSDVVSRVVEYAKI